MALCIPVIGSDSGEIPHVVGAAGRIVLEGDVEALRVGLMRLVNDAAMRERFSRAGRARVLEQFTQERVAQRTVTVYHEALGHREARR
jgi:glycosyltransferase involved in cell wall biosynthesis